MAIDPTLQPPKVGVPGPFKPTPPMTNRMRAVRQPGWRTLTVPHDTTVGEVAEQMYGSRSEWNRVYGHNRDGVTLPDGSSGFLTNPNQVIRQGQTLWLTN